jgi:hypothetical protein
VFGNEHPIKKGITKKSREFDGSVRYWISKIDPAPFKINNQYQQFFAEVDFIEAEQIKKSPEVHEKEDFLWIKVTNVLEALEAPDIGGSYRLPIQHDKTNKLFPPLAETLRRADVQKYINDKILIHERFIPEPTIEPTIIPKLPLKALDPLEQLGKIRKETVGVILMSYDEKYKATLGFDVDKKENIIHPFEGKNTSPYRIISKTVNAGELNLDYHFSTKDDKYHLYFVDIGEKNIIGQQKYIEWIPIDVIRETIKKTDPVIGNNRLSNHLVSMLRSEQGTEFFEGQEKMVESFSISERIAQTQIIPKKEDDLSALYMQLQHLKNQLSMLERLLLQKN